MRLLAWHALRGKLGVPPGLIALQNGDPSFSGGRILGPLGPRGGLGPCTYCHARRRQRIRGQATTGIHGDLKRQMIKVKKAALLHRGC